MSLNSGKENNIENSTDSSKPCDLCRNTAMGATGNKYCRKCSMRESLKRISLIYPVSVDVLLERLKIEKEDL